MSREVKAELTLQRVEAKEEAAGLCQQLITFGKQIGEFGRMLSDHPDSVLLQNAPADMANSEVPVSLRSSPSYPKTFEWSQVDTHEAARLLVRYCEVMRRLDGLKRKLAAV